MQQIAYANTASIPPARAQIDWTFSDGNTGAQGIGGALSVTGSTVVTITARNVAPVLTKALVNVGVMPDHLLSYVLPANTFSDANAGEALTLSASMLDGSELPPWLKFDAGTRTFSGTPGIFDVGALRVRVTAIDVAGASVSDDFMLAVGNLETVPPSLLSESPVDGATGVAPNTNITLTFDEAMARDSGQITLRTADGVIVETFDAATSGKLDVTAGTLTINPSLDLLYGHHYFLDIVPGALTDIAGNAFAGVQSYDFSTIAGSSTPSLSQAAGEVSASIANGKFVLRVTPANWQATSNTISLKVGYDASLMSFDAASMVGSGASSVSRSVTEAGNVGNATISMSLSNGQTSGAFVVSFVPKNANSTTFSASFSTVLINGQAKSLTIPTLYLDNAAPVAALFSPEDAATHVALNSDLVVTFDEVIQRGTGHITLKGASGEVVEVFDVSSSKHITLSGSILTIDPSPMLEANTGYALTIDAGAITDLHGNITSASSTSTFTTDVGTLPTGTFSISNLSVDFTDTPVKDVFAVVTGTIAGNNPNASELSYGIIGGTVVDGMASKSGAYGTLSVNVATAAYSFTPNNSAIEAMRSVATETFVISATDGNSQATANCLISIFGANELPTGTVTVTGAPTQGETLTASNTLADADGMGSIGYQWMADGATIAGAHGITLVLAQAQVGKLITVVAGYTDGFGTSESATGSTVEVVSNINDLPTGSVTIIGTPTQGETLTATNTLADVDGMGTISYQWKADGTAIAGATGNTLVLEQVKVGKLITVVASYTDGFGTLESVTGSVGKAVDLLAYTWKTHTLLDGVAISGANQTDSTDSSGVAGLTAVVETSVNLTVSRAVPVAEAASTSSAVNLQDAIAILKMIVGLPVNGANQPISPYQTLAADFDGNGTVGLTDAIGVLKHVVGLAAPEPTWHFVNEADTSVPSKTTLNPGTPQNTVTADLSGASPVHVGLVGYLSGDVDGSYVGPV